MKTKNRFTPCLLAASIALIITTPAHASIVRGDIDYQNFRDFAENKGQFGLDATNVEILDKQGQNVGTVLDGVPMMDFAVVSRTNGVATLVEPQYLASVQHNRGYQSVQFGDHSSNNPDNHHYDYQITNRHLTAPGVEINSWHREDYHTPRLHKLVTEVAPIATSDETHISGFTDKEKYTAFVRAGSGVQMVVDEQGGTPRQVAGAYNHMTGGQMLGSPSVYNHRAIPGQSQDVYLRFDGPNSLFNHPMGSSQRSGDSGSGVFAYDAQAGRWVYAASAQSSTGSNTFVISHLGLVDKNEQLSIAGDIIQSGQTLAWTPNGNTSTLSTNGQTLLTVGLFDESLAERDGINNGHWFRPRQDHGKTFTVMGENNIIQLADDINQGAGAIYFKGDTTVEGLKAGTTWLGAGVSIDKDKTVTWRVHNPTGDRLSKIGEGTLLVQGTGTNAGSISVGDGKVILDQQADSNGNKQAFSEVGIVSGRGTVVLNSKDQVNPDNIYFGFRGGRLDVNGNDLTFNRIQNADSGARIVNHNANQASNVSVKGFTAPKIEDIQLIPWERWSPTNSQTHLYEDRRYGYYILRGRWGTFIPGQPHENLSDENWEFVSKDKEEALALFNARRAERIKASGTNYHTGFNGVLGETDETRGANGELNIAYNPSLTGAKWLLTGGSNLNGTLSTENGTVLMSGRPTPHAYDFIGNKEVIIEGDWQNRNFKATTFEAKTDGKIAIGRNVDTVIGDFKGTGNGEIQAGFTQSKSDACLRSDRTGAVTCDTPTLSDKDLASWERTQIVGRVNLADQSRFTVGSKGHFIGTLFGTDDSTLALDKDAIWTMTGDSGVRHLVADDAVVNLNANFEQGQSNHYNRLTIGELSGQGTFNYLTDIGQLASDKIVVDNASGDFKLNVKNSGAEPTHNDRLVLLTAEQENNFKVALANPDERVDIGAYRYELVQDGPTYRLYSPKIEQEFLDKAEAERLERERIEAERQAELARQEAERQAELARQEAERLERERQAELAKQEAERIEAERQAELAKQEAERLERERIETERQAELARQEAERIEAERQAELARQEAERLEAERQAELARQEAERQTELARQEAARLEAERQAELAKQEAERLERERLEAERQAELAKQEAERQAELVRQEAERLERERQAELAKQEAERLEAERQAEEAARQAELARQEAERQAELAKQEAERQAELARQEAARLEAERQAELARQEAERLERERIEAERQAELTRQEAERLERERLEAERQAELARQEAERQAELAKQEAERLERERIEAERQAELARQEAERIEAERQAELAKQEAERLERERLEAERQTELARQEAERQAELARQEAERIEAERQAELARQEAERLERERQAELAKQEAERLERERIEAERQAELAKQEAERQAELARQEAERQAELAKQEAERIEAERQAELARQEAERLEAERRAELAKQEAERLEAERQAELARQEAERIEAERQAELAKQEAERLERERLEAERQAELARQEAERLEAERQAELAKQEAERIEAERQVELAKQEAERIEAERQAELAKQEAERLERERIEAERQAELVRQEAERIEAERQAELARQEAERLERERQAELAKQEAERLERERLEAERQAELAKQEAERLEAERLAREQAQREAAQRNQADYISRYTNAGLSEIAGTAHTLSQINRGLNSHILADDTPNVWVNTQISDNTHQSTLYRPFDKADTLVQVGIQEGFDNTHGRLHIGVVHSRHDSKQSYADHITNEQDTRAISVFTKQTFENGVFLAGDISAGVTNSHLSSQGENIDLKRKVASAGIHAGKAFTTPVVDIEPSVSVRYDRLSDENYTLNQAVIESDDIGIVSYRAGLKLSKEFITAGGSAIRPFVASEWTDSSSETTLMVNQHRFTQAFERTTSHALGLEVDKDAWKIRISGSHTDSNESEGRTEAALSVGFRW